jgi:hypothetical protein
MSDISIIITGWFHGTCDTFTPTLTKSFETFRTCVIINSKTFLLLDQSYRMSWWRAVAQIPSTLLNGFLKFVIPCNSDSFALLCAIEILMIDSDSPSSGLSESLFEIFFWSRLWTLGLWKPFWRHEYSKLKNSITRELWTSGSISSDRASEDLSNHICAVGREWDFVENGSPENQH